MAAESQGEPVAAAALTERQVDQEVLAALLINIRSACDGALLILNRIRGMDNPPGVDEELDGALKKVHTFGGPETGG